MENPKYLPEEILIEIFSWLPPKPVGRFRCLSKPWRRNLSTSEFVKSHLSRTTHQKDSVLLVGYSSIRTISNPLDENYAVVPRNFDSPDVLGSKPAVAGSCNGLVLLVGQKEEENLVVMNPLTLEQVSIANTPVDIDSKDVDTGYGFGYDSCSDDYKIVKLSVSYTVDDEKSGPFVDVYSMKKGFWKRINNFPFSAVIYFGNGILVNGVIHWLAYVKDFGEDGQYEIAAFDVATESFVGVPVPNNEMGGEYSYILFGFRGCLFIISMDDFGVWIMKEYGRVNSVTNCLTTSVSNLLDSAKLLCPIGEDEVLLSSFDRRNLIVWKLTEGRIKAVIVNGGVDDDILEGCTFVDSLVSPIQCNFAS